MATLFMNLTLPEPREALSPTWATELNTALTSVDSHTHESTSGQRLTPAGISIDQSWSFGGNDQIDANGLTYQNKTALYTVDLSMTSKGGELYFRDTNSNNVQLTSGGSINFVGNGGVDGDYSSTLASAYYTDSTLSYTFEDSNQNPGGFIVKDITNTTVLADSITVATMTASVASTFAAVAMNGTTTVSGDMALNGNNSGRGIIPIGAVMAIATNLTGVSIPTGYQALDGTAVSDGDSPMDGVTLPNINNSVFLAGNSTAGTSNGANSYSLVESQLPSHLHTINNSHADTFALSSASGHSSASHTHNIAHTHQWTQVTDNVTKFYTKTASDNTSTSITNTDTLYSDATIKHAGGVGDHIYDVTFSTLNFHTTGAIDASTGSGATAVSGGSADSTTVTIGGAVTDNAGDSGSVGSGSSIDNMPNYISTQFIIRIK